MNKLVSVFLLCAWVGLNLAVPFREPNFNSSDQPRSTLSSKDGQSIHSVDFSNFVYPIIELSADVAPAFRPIQIFGAQNVELKNGEHKITSHDGYEPLISLQQVVYGDVSGDGKEEAIVAIRAHDGGTQSWGFLYIYSMFAGKPKLLQGFLTGDRAYEGLHKAYANNGELIIELYDPENNAGDCCPTQISRSRYQWRHDRFLQVAKSVIKKLPQETVSDKK